jgi:hypothetical protein
MPIRWSTFVTDADGVVDYDRCKQLAILAAFAGGCLVMLTATVLEITKAVEIPAQMIVIMGAALIAPITGQAFGSAVGKHLQAKAVASATANAMAQTGESATP